MTARQLKRQIERTQKIIEELEKNCASLSMHGRWSLGYWQGRLMTMEDWLDCIEPPREVEE